SAAPGIARSLYRAAGRLHRDRSRRLHAPLLRLRVRSHHAGIRSLRISGLLRAQGSFSPERAVRAEKRVLATGECRAAHRAADAARSFPEHGRFRETAESETYSTSEGVKRSRATERTDGLNFQLFQPASHTER